MKEKFYGDKNTGFKGSIEIEPSDKIHLKPCPFCGGTDLEVCNTHTHSYWVECHDCGVKKPGRYEEMTHKESKDKKKVIWYHYRAAASAQTDWNQRANE